MRLDISQYLPKIHDNIESDNVEGAIVACFRVARCKNDYLNAAIFMRELYPNKEEVVRTIYDMASKIDSEAQKFIYERSLDRWLEIHDMEFLSSGQHEKGEDPTILKIAVGEIEPEIKRCQAMIDDVSIPQGMHHFDTAAFYHENLEMKLHLRRRIQALNALKARLKVRCLNYVIHVESNLNPQNINESLLWKLQDSVDSHFKQASSVVFEKLQRASVLSASQDGEDYALLLTEVRRALSAVADMYYPASRCATTCADGQARKLTEDKYLNRLEEYLRTECQATTSTELAQAELNLLAKFMRKLNDLASKGVHATVTQEEAHQGFVGMYLFLSTFIRLAKKTG